ncbi:hypothetical protein C8J57DRAFT_1218540 [Mycena rebaudengoi]|nr:hypothetical protein C8J57DRAFT_1218540 [Mycena rebaudengoi]
MLVSAKTVVGCEFSSSTHKSVEREAWTRISHILSLASLLPDCPSRGTVQLYSLTAPTSLRSPYVRLVVREYLEPPYFPPISQNSFIRNLFPSWNVSHPHSENGPLQYTTVRWLPSFFPSWYEMSSMLFNKSNSPPCRSAVPSHHPASRPARDSFVRHRWPVITFPIFFAANDTFIRHWFRTETELCDENSTTRLAIHDRHSLVRSRSPEPVYTAGSGLCRHVPTRAEGAIERSDWFMILWGGVYADTVFELATSFLFPGERNRTHTLAGFVFVGNGGGTR